MSIEEFILKIEAEFTDLKPGLLKPETKYREVFEWNSVNALILIAMVSTEYDVVLNADDIRSSVTIRDIYKVVENRVKK
jgi:acyl carrier protein